MDIELGMGQSWCVGTTIYNKTKVGQLIMVSTKMFWCNETWDSVIILIILLSILLEILMEFGFANKIIMFNLTCNNYGSNARGLGLLLGIKSM